MAVEGSCSRGHQTYTGEFTLNGQPITIYRHWSHEGNYGIFTGENLANLIGEIIAENWFPMLDENGVQVKDENGIYDLMNCNIGIALLEESGDVVTETPIPRDDCGAFVTNGYFETKDGRKFYNLYAKYDAKLNIANGQAWSVSNPNYRRIAYPEINTLLQLGLLTDKNYGRHEN